MIEPDRSSSGNTVFGWVLVLDVKYEDAADDVDDDDAFDTCFLSSFLPWWWGLPLPFIIYNSNNLTTNNDEICKTS